ncbi:MAG: glutamate 5-kinase [Deltaproteobacteria bacterium]|nr:glutamate 5-kinase [Deltaproteobacteria bacterium]
MNERATLGRCRRVVVKIGSKGLTAGADGMFENLAGQLARAHRGSRRRREIVLVSSGAIALGVQHLGMKRRPTEMAGLQAAAAAGQGLLMQRYGEVFGACGLKVAQVLLSHADLASRDRANNARAALNQLLELGVVPIINENDAVATDEIRFGDNDELAAMVTSLTGSELLVLLSDVEGLLDAEKRRVPYVPQLDAATLDLATAEISKVGRGGMKSKLESARRATLAGAHVVIASASQPDVLARVLGGEDVGTLFPARSKPLSTRKHWIAYTLRPRGVVIVDDGAARAIERDGSSVLCVGVVGVRGGFGHGDLITVKTLGGDELARGLAGMSASEAARLAGVTGKGVEPLIHRDDLVVLPR